jgi:hypothetical protein
LINANLAGANLTGAFLRGADLREADLAGAILRGAILREADLSGADLTGAILREANLTEADLYGANLTGADLTGAILRGADLAGANLAGANLAPVTESAIRLLLDFANQVAQNPETLSMGEAHDECVAAHCAAGWICILNPIAKTLESILGRNAAACIACPIPEFTGLFGGTDAEMLAFAAEVAADQGAAIREKYGLPINRQA